MGRAGDDPQDALLHGSLKQLVCRLPEAELLQLRGWIEREIPRARVRGPRLLTFPTPDDLLHWEGTLAELAGAIRRSIHDLPESSLLIVNNWVLDQLAIYRHTPPPPPVRVRSGSGTDDGRR